MGNVVVSEALRHGGDLDVTSYAANESAEVAGAYDANVADMAHRLWIKPEPQCFESRLYGPEEAWRCYNTDIVDGTFAMPPDKYRYNVPAVHGPTTDENMALLSVGPPYHAGIFNNVGRTVNFYNGPDAALSAWEFQQLTKPDRNNGPTWSFNADSCTTCGSLLRQDRYERGDSPLTWSGTVPLTEDDANILAHIIPARTLALGQTVPRPLSGGRFAALSDALFQQRTANFIAGWKKMSLGSSESGIFSCDLVLLVAFVDQ